LKNPVGCIYYSENPNHKESLVSQDAGRKKINVANFVEDFARGASDTELREKYALDQSQLARIVGVLKEKGEITHETSSQREENLKIRFGSPQGPADSQDKATVDLNTGLVLHCPSCGAAVKRGGAKCEYCSAALDFSLKGKIVSCPHCFASIPADSRFCIRCAKPVLGLIKEGVVQEDRLCPRCELAMRAKKIGDFSVLACEKCNGLFAPHETFEMMQENSQRVIFPTETTRKGPLEPEAQVRYVRCPVCRTMMNRSNFAKISGVIIDTCKGHGVWFDPGEIEKIMDFIAHGGLQRATGEELERLKAEEKLQKIKNMQVTGQANSDYWGHNLDGRDGEMALDVIDWVGRLFKR
jgi:Zn-finger nucleic acid-binding protein